MKICIYGISKSVWVDFQLIWLLIIHKETQRLYNTDYIVLCKMIWTPPLSVNLTFILCVPEPSVMKFVNKMRTTLDTQRSWLDLILVKVTSLLYCTTNAVKFEIKTTIHSFWIFRSRWIYNNVHSPSFFSGERLSRFSTYILYIQ